MDNPLTKDMDWNTKSKYYVSSNSVLEPITHAHIIKDSEPNTDALIKDYISRHKLNHGDIVNFHDYRQTDAKIVFYNEDTREYSFIDNPDDSGSGYLTIPQNILANVTDFKSKYEEILDYIEDNGEVINFNISPKDKFVVDKFGEIPGGYKFDVHLMDREYIEIFAVKKDNLDYSDFDYEYTKWEEIESYFIAAAEEQKEFSVNVKLVGDDLNRYKSRYGDTESSFATAWMNQTPDLPNGWRVEKGMSSSCISASYRWTWKLKGPKSSVAVAKDSVKEFLKDFDYTFL